MSSLPRLAPLCLMVAVVLGEPQEGFAAQEPATVSSLAKCDSRVRAAPSILDGYRCYLEQARRHQDWETSALRLEALLGNAATRGGAAFFLAAVQSDRGGDGAISLYRQAAELFGERGDIAGEVAAKTALAAEFITRQHMAEAEAAAEGAAVLAEATGEPTILARARLGQAQVAIAQEQVSKAWTLAQEAEGILRSEGPTELRIELFRVLGYLRWVQGKYEPARSDYLQAVELATEAGDDFTAAMVRYSAAFIEVNKLYVGGAPWEEAILPMRTALQHALRTGNLAAELRCRLALGQATADDEALEHYRRSAELAERLHDFDRSLFATRFYAYALLNSSPEQAERILNLLATALQQARAKGDLVHEILGRMSLATAAWILTEETYALREAHAALDAIERGRSLQRRDEVRARWYSRYGWFSKRVSGWLLQKAAAGSASSANELDEALRIMERFRGRVFLDASEAATVAAGRESPRSKHVEVLRQIAAVQRRLRDPDLGEVVRGDALLELGRLEAAESSLRVQALQSADGAQTTYPVPQVSLAALREALGPDEAVVAFQLFIRESNIAENENPGSWIVLITREGWAVRALPDEGDIQSALPIYLGLLERADGSESAAAVHLYQELFQGVLETLPENVRRMVLVLDPLLEGAPLGTLRASPESAPLADRFELARVPSIAAFLHSRSLPVPAHPIPVLAFADPTSPRDADDNIPTARSALLSLTNDLESLPFAREQGRNLVRRLGHGSVLRQGEEATESWLKSEDLSHYSVLHFGAHAVVDDANPERSAVVLAPGDESQDGLLQARDLAELGLTGQLVVLAACRSAAGDVIDGEGAMGLARAFILAGASTVVASLWPLQDDLAADLFGRFYRHLAEGSSVGAALQAAQRELRQQGVPARGWAGVVIMGDATMTPVLAPARSNWISLALLAALILATASFLVIRKRG